MDEFDIHNTERDYERTIVRVKNSQISEKNKKLILKFNEECLSNSISIKRVLFYLNRLYKVAEFLRRDFDRATKEDIKDLVRRIELKQGYSEWTKSSYRVSIKKFYQWLSGFEWNSKEYPEKVRWIKTGVKKDRGKIINILTEEEVKKLIDGANGVRDKALISVLYESGCRIGELLNVKMKDVEFDDYGVVMQVRGKTGPRRIRLVSSVSRLSVWIEHHPKKNDPETPLWVNTGTTNHNKAMKYTNVRKLLRDVAKKVGLKKRVNPHAFRHTRATHLASKLTEAQMDEYLGWVQGSEMPSIYVHLSGRNIDDAILKMNGLIPKDKHEVEEFKTKKCPRCFYENPPESKFCLRCRLPLDAKTAIEFGKRKKEFMATVITPEVIEKMIEEKVRQILKD